MNIQELLKSLSRSGERLQAMARWDLAEPIHLHLLKRESWIHLKRSLKLWLKLKFHKGGNPCQRK